jgi:TPP-dependent indolepyruvate ferredoxin oxidoreductase alpha subunit
VTLKGENGLMRKRFNGLEKSIDEQKGEIRRLHEAQDTLYTTIATHEKDIQAFKEVRDPVICYWCPHEPTMAFAWSTGASDCTTVVYFPN